MYLIKRFPLLCRQLAHLCRAGLPFQVALTSLVQDTQNSKYKRRLEQVLTAVKQGESLPRSLSYLLPDYCHYTIGQDSPILDIPMYLERLAGFYEERLKIFQKTMVSLLYPMLLLCFSAVLALSFMFFLVPMYVRYFEQSFIAMPRFLAIVYTLYMGINTYPERMLCFMGISSLFVIVWFYRVGRYRIMSWLLGQHHSDLLWHFGIHLQQGIPLCVLLAHDFSDKSGINVGDWQRFYTLFLDTGSFSHSWARTFVLSHYYSDWLLGIEKSPDFGYQLSVLADSIRTDIWTKKSRYLSFIQPCLIVGIGMMVGVFVYTIYIPILSWN